jgi:WS/DGAT/MGAT family acyltransferase
MAAGDAAYEPMSAADRAFLACEDRCKPMHLGGIAIFELGPLATAAGGVDIDRLRRHVASRLHLVPRYRQRLAWIPFQSHPAWVDDEDFNIAYHVRHVALPRSGDERELKHLCGQIMSQHLDRAKPLWEIWVVEGLDGGRFAMLIKTHHCLADGIAAFDVFAALLSPVRDGTVAEPAPWIPRPAPGGLALLRDDLVRRTTLPVALAEGVRAALAEPGGLRARLREILVALRETIVGGLRVPPETPLNRPVGPHRRFDWWALDLAAAKAVKNRLGGTVNDVMLATVAGAVRRFLVRRGTDPHGVEFRIVVPVNVRTPDESGLVTNRVSGWLLALPVGEADAALRLAAVRAETARLRSLRQELGPVVLGQAAEWAPHVFFAAAVRLASRLSPYNLIVTNVAGPQVPLYMVGARLLGGYPQVPLFENQALGIGVFSYLGRLGWGFTADWDALPDLHAFVEDVEASFRELEETAAEARAAAG